MSPRTVTDIDGGDSWDAQFIFVASSPVTVLACLRNRSDRAQPLLEMRWPTSRPVEPAPDDLEHLACRRSHDRLAPLQLASGDPDPGPTLDVVLVPQREHEHREALRLVVLH